jgi:soluble lytic murein transglycosylase
MTEFIPTCRALTTTAIVFLATQMATPAIASDTEKQRELFDQVFATVERGDWSVIDDLPATDYVLLQQYALWPDLRATWLRVNIKKTPAADVDSFLSEYGALRPARELRYRHALNLDRNGNLAGYLRIYEQYYQGLGFVKLDCMALRAELAAGRTRRVDRRAIDLWLVGTSQVSECNSAFEYLADNNLLGPIEYLKRYDLAIEKRNFTLARWLAKEIDKQHVDRAAQWQKAHAHPEDFLRRKRRQGDSEVLREQLVYAAERLTYRDPEIALERWNKVVKKYKFGEAQKMRTARHIAVWTARDELPGAYDLLAGLSIAAQNDDVLRWRARISLLNSQWVNLLTDISLMSDEERESEDWRYWRAVALKRSGQLLATNDDLEKLSLEHSYYGFLAADELGKNYALDHATLLADEAAILALGERHSIIRARELFLVGQEGRGRSEWDAAIRSFSDADKKQAAILADRWGWHSRAISTSASLDEFDDLTLRYPLPYQKTFEDSSLLASIAPTWAYGIARSESLFMRDVRSSAGAVGLMQLMPATGRKVAKDISLPYSGLATLTDPVSNIRLGTTYLGQMAKRYSGNQVLATAAYNAGPHRVDRWLPENGALDARIWIENIPFTETRKYVKRVLAAQAIFHWRMTGEMRRLSDELLLIQSEPGAQQIAAR